MSSDPKVGDIYKQAVGSFKVYITAFDKVNNIIHGIFEDGFSFRCDLEDFLFAFEPTGDRVPFEDIAAILFPDKYQDTVDNMFKGE